MFQNLLTRLRETFASLVSFGRKGHVQPENDPVKEKLHDIKWHEDEDEASIERLVAGSQTKGDDLVETVYRARPQNPLSDN